MLRPLRIPLPGYWERRENPYRSNDSKSNRTNRTNEKKDWSLVSQIYTVRLVYFITIVKRFVKINALSH